MTVGNVEGVTAPPSSTLPPVRDGDHVAGSDAPELTLVEYGDFGCRFCFAASRPVMSLLDRFDTLRLVWRHFPDAELHPGADLAAELSELAADHGRFWDAYSLLLGGRERFSRQDLLSAARRLELDDNEAEAALGERRFRERVLADIAGAKRAGVHATPTFFVDGERLEGPWRQLAQIVPAKLEKTNH
jgi:protein-disulfide isomerase